MKAGAKYSIKQVAIKEGHDLPTGTGAVRRKFRCADTVGHALLHRPCNSLSKISTGRYVGKTAIHGHLRTSSQLPKICNGSGSGTRRASTAFGHQILLVGPAQCFVERTGFCHIRCGTSGVGVGRTVGAPQECQDLRRCACIAGTKGGCTRSVGDPLFYSPADGGSKGRVIVEGQDI